MVKILTFGASQRQQKSLNRNLIQVASEAMADKGASITFVEYREICPPLFDDNPVAREAMPIEALRFVDELEKCDGLAISVPEYNWSIPASFKNLIDWVSCLRPYPFTAKPIWLLCATPSRKGGVTGLTQTQIPLRALGAHVFPYFFFIGDASNILDGGVKLTDLAMQKEIELMAEDYVEYVRKLIR